MTQIAIADIPEAWVPYLNASRRGDRPERKALPVFRAEIAGLPASAPHMLATADLQGRTSLEDDPATLVGCQLGRLLDDLLAEEVNQGRLGERLALLAGDFYARPGAKKRGGLGDVRPVWQAMNRDFREVVGVLGNHDTFSGEAPNSLLDGTAVEQAGLRLGGVGGIIGNPDKPNRRSPKAYVDAVLRVLIERSDILIVHEAPQVDNDHPGSPDLAEALCATEFPGIVICGHVDWPSRVQSIGCCTILNVHEAIVLLDPVRST